MLTESSPKPSGLPVRSGGSASIAPGLLVITASTALAFGLATIIGPLSSLVAALLIGAIAGNLDLIRPDWAPGFTFATKRLLRVGVVLLGLRLSFADLAALGIPTLVVVAGTVAATFFGTQWIGRRLGLSRDLALLIATGYSICGASAIVAVEGSTDADEEEVLTAIGLVTLFGSVAVAVLPFLAGAFDLTDAQFGTWVGASVHDVAQVVAASSTGGSAVVSVAIVVKLSRVVLLAPIVAGVNIQRSRERGRNVAETDESAERTRPPLLPLFVVGFLVAIGVRSSGLLSLQVIEGAQFIEKVMLTAALVGLGSGVRLARLRRLGPMPLLLGSLAWVVVAVVSLGATLIAV